MTANKDDAYHLKTMRHEIKQYLRGEQSFAGLIRALDAGIFELADCPRDLVERMSEELRTLRELNGMPAKGNGQGARPREHGMLHDPVAAMERVINVALSVVEAKNARRRRP